VLRTDSAILYRAVVSNGDLSVPDRPSKVHERSPARPRVHPRQMGHIPNGCEGGNLQGNGDSRSALADLGASGYCAGGLDADSTIEVSTLGSTRASEARGW
jgi:hypothetical protein